MRQDWLFRAWTVFLTLVVLAPLLAPGYVLSYDMVWVPDWSVTRADVWGLGSSLPRAVPSDAVVSVLDLVLPSWLIQKSMLIAVFLFAGLGMGRLIGPDSALAKFAAATFYVWNPFVAERLAIGHWPVLVGYAALPWLIWGLADITRRRVSVLALAASALSPVTGLVALLVVAVMFSGSLRHRVGWLGITLALNAPWLIAGLTHPSVAQTDPGAVEFFAAEAAGSLTRLGSVLSLGGIWNSDVVLASRELPIAWLWVTLIWFVIGLGLTRMHRTDRGRLIRLSVLAIIGLSIAVLGAFAGSSLVWLIETVPGAGLLRDGTRFLILVAPLFALAFGHGVAAMASWKSAPSAVLGGVLVLVPIAAIPDFAWGLSGQLKAVHYPSSWAESREVIANSTTPGDIVVVPFESYRAPEFNHGRPVFDPSGKFYPRHTLVNDDLYVSNQKIDGEDERANQIDAALVSAEPAQALGQLGISFVVGDNPAAVSAIDGERVFERLDRVVIQLESTREAPEPAQGRRVAVIVGWVTATLALVAGLWPLQAQGAVDRRRKRPKN